MNDLDFKRHLKDLVHGHHHPEEHDWERPAVAPKTTRRAKASASKPARRAARKKSTKA